MKEYFNKRVKIYITIIVGFPIGFLISGLIFKNPDYITGFIAVSVGLIIGELFIFIPWVKNRNKTNGFDK